jgi:glucokinase
MLLGIEIGGTKLQLGVGDGKTAELADLVRLPVDRTAGAAGILDSLARVGSRLITEHPVDGVGIGFGGPVDMSTGVTIRSHQVDGWERFPLAAWCERELGVSASVANDCDVAALAEATLGAGRGHRLVLYVTVGTGVGGGLVMDGEIFADHRPARTEIGHMRPGLAATSAAETVESLASGLGIEESVRRRLSEGDERDARRLLDAAGVASTADVTTEAIAVAAAAGDPLAAHVFGEATRALGWAIAQAITLTAAECIVVGGGVSLAGEELFFEPLRRHVSAYVFPALANTYQIVSAALAEEVVVHGAIALARGGRDERR